VAGAYKAPNTNNFAINFADSADVARPELADRFFVASGYSIRLRGVRPASLARRSFVGTRRSGFPLAPGGRSSLREYVTRSYAALGSPRIIPRAIVVHKHPLNPARVGAAPLPASCALPTARRDGPVVAGIVRYRQRARRRQRCWQDPGAWLAPNAPRSPVEFSRSSRALSALSRTRDVAGEMRARSRRQVWGWSY
jgi:hypothetical protein